MSSGIGPYQFVDEHIQTTSLSPQHHQLRSLDLLPIQPELP